MNLWSVIGKNLQPTVRQRMAGSMVEQAARGSAREAAEQVSKHADTLILGKRKVMGVGEMVDAFLAKNPMDKPHHISQDIQDAIILHETKIYSMMDIRDTELMSTYARVFSDTFW